MKLKKLPYDLTVAKLKDFNGVSLSGDLFFISRTDEEISLVCKTADVPPSALKREDGWKAFRIEGVLDFSLIGILSRITGILAENNIGIFAASTYNTDYILVKRENFDRAMKVLEDSGYTVI